MSAQFLRIEIGLSISGFIVFVIYSAILIIGLIAIGMCLGRRRR